MTSILATAAVHPCCLGYDPIDIYWSAFAKRSKLPEVIIVSFLERTVYFLNFLGLSDHLGVTLNVHTFTCARRCRGVIDDHKDAVIDGDVAGFLAIFMGAKVEIVGFVGATKHR